MVPRVRIELTTQGFSVLRSTTELPRHARLVVLSCRENIRARRDNQEKKLNTKDRWRDPVLEIMGSVERPLGSQPPLRTTSPSGEPNEAIIRTGFRSPRSLPATHEQRGLDP